MRQTGKNVAFYSYIAGRPLRFGLLLALIVVAIDQSYKYWMIYIFDIAGRRIVEITPFFDLVMVWNRGISYGLFQQDTAMGRYILLGITLAMIAVLVIWLARVRDKWLGLALGFIIGGAISNASDRAVYGAVADFFSAHAFGYNWYVFNLADVAIVAGVGLLLYDTIKGGGEQP